MAKKATTGDRESRGPARSTAKSTRVPGGERRRDRSRPVDLGRALLEAFLTNERIKHITGARFVTGPASSEPRSLPSNNFRCGNGTSAGRKSRAIDFHVLP